MASFTTRDTDPWFREYSKAKAVINAANGLQEPGLMRFDNGITSFITLHKLEEALLEPKRQSAGREGALRGAEQPQKMQTWAKIASLPREG